MTSFLEHWWEEGCSAPIAAEPGWPAHREGNQEPQKQPELKCICVCLFFSFGFLSQSYSFLLQLFFLWHKCVSKDTVCAGTKSLCIQESPWKTQIHPWPHRNVQAAGSGEAWRNVMLFKGKELIGIRDLCLSKYINCLILWVSGSFLLPFLLLSPWLQCFIFQKNAEWQDNHIPPRMQNVHIKDIPYYLGFQILST